MKLEIRDGKITGIENQILNPKLPTTDLSYVNDKDMYKEIRNYIKNDHPNLENKFILEDGVMKHSNTYLATAVDMFFKKFHPEYRLATQLDLEQDLDFTKGTYNDSGLALRNLTGTNPEQAKYIFEQLKQRGFKEKDFPLWIQLNGLDLTKDLNFDLTDESFYKTVECLNWENQTGFSKINDFGLPKEKDSNSSRKIWTSNNALSGFSLDGNSNLNSRNDDLSDSSSSGRVVLKKSRSDAPAKNQ